MSAKAFREVRPTKDCRQRQRRLAALVSAEPLLLEESTFTVNFGHLIRGWYIPAGICKNPPCAIGMCQ